MSQQSSGSREQSREWSEIDGRPPGTSLDSVIFCEPRSPDSLESDPENYIDDNGQSNIYREEDDEETKDEINDVDDDPKEKPLSRRRSVFIKMARAEKVDCKLPCFDEEDDGEFILFKF